MIQTAPSTKTTSDRLPVLIISSILITLYLFYLDEGYYNFKWMTSVSNWIAFMVYALSIFIGQLFVSSVILKKYHGLGKVLLSVFGGAVIGVLFVMYAIFTNW